MEAPGFWDDAEAAQEKSKLLKGLKDDVETCAHLYQQYEDIETLIQMGYEENDEELAQEAREEFDSFVQTLDNIKIRTLLSGEYDKCNAILTGAYFSVQCTGKASDFVCIAGCNARY